LQEKFQCWNDFAFLIKETGLIVFQNKQFVVSLCEHHLVFFAKEVLNSQLLLYFLINLLNIRF
jgi:GTP cyclohydrolase I